MTETIRINAGKGYDVKIGPGLLQKAGDLAAETLRGKKAALFTDSVVAGLYADIVEESFRQAGFETCRFVFPAGEDCKNMQTAAAFVDFMSEHHLTRKDAVITLGGGVAGDMAGNIDQVSHSTSQLRDSIAGTQTAMEDLTSGTSETAAAIQVQQQQTENIDQQVQNVSSVTAELLSSTAETSANLTASKDVMKNLVQQVQVSEASSTRVADSMEELKEYADKMQSIVALISSVASQTSLLALNASIEAARAGEAGRGFAVVAEEISSLAGQTNGATGDINQLIEHISQSISSVTDSVTELFDSNRHQSEYITSAAGYFDLIEKNTASITSGMSELKQGVDAVSDSNSQIIQSIENVSALTQEVTASAGATLAGCRTNLQSVDDIALIMQQLQENANELQKNTQ